MGFVWVYMQKMELNWFKSVDTVGIKSAGLDDKFLFECFVAFRIA